MRDIDLKVERVPLDALKAYKGNAKEHPAEQVEQIAESMREFGNCDPIARKLTDEQVREIRADNRSSRKIAADYGVSHSTVNSIKNGKYMSHVR